MSSFLVNLARRGAGLPATKIQAPPPSPFGPEIRKHGDGLAEEPATLNVGSQARASEGPASQAPLYANSSEEFIDLPFKAPIPDTASAQRPSETEPSTSKHPSVGEPRDSIRPLSLEPMPAPRQQVISNAREAEGIEPPKHPGSAVPLVFADSEAITTSAVERSRDTSPVLREIEPAGKPVDPTSVTYSHRVVITKPSERQVVAPAELSAEWTRNGDGEQKTREPAPPASAIRPALGEAPTLFQFPKVTSAPSSSQSSQLPIHVRIGRVEVRTTTAPASMPARPSPPARQGFDSYYRQRNYRN